MAAYIVVALCYTGKVSGDSPYTLVDIVVDDTAHTGFVTHQDIEREIDSLPQRCSTIPRRQVNTYAISRHLNALRNIESATVTALNDGSLRIRVVPMQPVARVFDADGSQHYVNRQGKRLTASVDYNVDVPVVFGRLDRHFPLSRLLPLLDYLKANPTTDRFVTAITITPTHDIIITPPMRGHVINLGDSHNLPDKWHRLETFYRQVMPRQGWEYYDTVSVKWRGQIVATRRHKAITEGTVLEAVVNDSIPVEDDIDINDEASQALLQQ